jgi:hypothetical protein
MSYTDEMGTFSRTMTHITSTELLKESMKLQQHLQEITENLSFRKQLGSP